MSGLRRVRGRTDRVVVVGAGLGGLSAALRLAGAGRQVTVLERADVPGGRNGLLAEGGYTFDTGPTVLTLPGLVGDALRCVGEELDDWLDLERLDPAYRARFADGSVLDVHADVEAMAEEVRAFAGPAEADGFRRFTAFAARLFELEMRSFIDRNLDSPLSLVSPQLARLAAMGGFRRLAPKVGQYLRDDRLQRMYTFQAMYAGLSPYQALAIYAVISYMDGIAGVWFPRGGMHAVPRALAGAAEKHGVEMRYGTEVTGVELRGSRAVGVRTADGDVVPADVVVLNPDLPVARSALLRRPLRRRLRYSPSCVVLHAGARLPGTGPGADGYADAAHHTISFGTAWRRTFDELAGGRLMSDPSLLVTTPTVTDPTLAPAGRSTHYVLLPVPNLETARGRLDWTPGSADRARVRAHLLDTVEARGWPGLAGRIEVEHLVTPHEWERQGMAAGTPFAAAHTFAQTGPFRPRNLWGDNVVFTGSGTQPGVGVPMALVSGRLAAERVVGPVA